MPSELKQRAVKSVGWLGAGQFVKQGLSLVFTGLLARMVAPGAFGLIGMVAVFVSFFEMFQELGLSSAVIQQKDPTDEQLSTVFVITVGLGMLLAAATVGMGPLAAAFYDEPELVKIAPLLGLKFFISSFIHVPSALLRKELKFRRLVIIGVVANMLSGAIGVGLAFAGAGVYALVAKTLSFTFFDALLIWVVCGWRPTARPRLGSVRSMVSFGANLTGSSFLLYVIHNADYMLIGRFLGKTPLGYYTLAYRIMRLPLRRLTAQVAKVAFPTFSAVQDNKPRVRRGFLQMTRYIALIAFPAMTGLLLVAPEAIPVLLKPKWLPVVPLVQILSLTGALLSVTAGVSHIFRSQGRADWQFRYHVVATPVYVAAFAIGLQWGVVGVAVGYAAAHAVLAPAMCYIGFRLINLRIRDYLASMRGPFVAAAAMGAGVFAYKLFAQQVLGFGQAAVLWTEIPVGVLLYGAGVAVIAPSIYRRGFELAKLFFRRRGERKAAKAGSEGAAAE